MNPDRTTSAEGDAIPYRSISSLAVAAAVAGALSVGSLIGPALWIVPLVAIALAIAALVEIGREGSMKVGRVPALIGLALAVGFGVQAVSHRVAHDWIVAARGRTAAFEFVRAVREGRLADAENMCGMTALPPIRAEGHELPGPGGPDEPAGEAVSLDAFAAMPAVALLARCGGEGDATLTGEPAPEDLSGAHAFLVEVPCGSVDAGKRSEAQVRIVVEPGAPDAMGSAFDRWRVVRHEAVTPAIASGTMP